MSAIVTTDAFAFAAAPNGVTISPISAFFVRTTASKGARIVEYSRDTLAPCNAA